MPIRIIFIIFVAVSLFNIEASAQNVKHRAVDPGRYNPDPDDEKLKKLSISLKIEDAVAVKRSTFRIAKDKNVIIQVLAEVSDHRTIALGYANNQFTRFTLLLLDDNNAALTYPTSTREKLRREWNNVNRRKDPDAVYQQSGPSLFVSPNQENVIGRLDIADWYGKLGAGTYRIIVKFGFGNNENENKIQSKIITLEIY